MTTERRADPEEITGLYRRHALAWALRRGTDLPERFWIDRFAREVGQGGTVLDIGCGSGVPVAAHLLSAGCRVHGIDSAPEMVELFLHNLKDASAEVEDMRTLELERRFEGLIAWDSFFHLSHDNQRAMFPIFRAHARPGAPFLFSSGPEHGEATGTFEGEPLYHASLAPSEYRDLLERSGFELVDHCAEDSECGGRTVWLARRL